MKKYLGLVIVMFFAVGCEDKLNEIIDKITPSLSASKVLDLADSSLESAGGSFGAFAPRSGDCDGMVSDLTSDAAGVGNYLSCLLSTNSKSPDTMRGSFHFVKEIISMVEDQVDFTNSSDFTAHENISGNIDVSGATQNITVSIRERRLSSDSDWGNQIQVCILILNGSTQNASLNDCVTGSFNVNLFVTSSLKTIAFKAAQFSGGTFTNGASYVLDLDSQEVRFEAWDEDSNRHQRLFTAASINSDFELGNVTQVTVATASASIEASGDGIDAIFASFNGSSLCADIWDDSDGDHSNGVGTGVNSNLQVVGTCSAYPSYDGGFFDSSSSAQSYLDNANSGVLGFDEANFSISSYIPQ